MTLVSCYGSCKGGKECRILLPDIKKNTFHGTGDAHNLAFKWWNKLPGSHQRCYRGTSDAQNLVGGGGGGEAAPFDPPHMKGRITSGSDLGTLGQRSPLFRLKVLNVRMTPSCINRGQRVNIHTSHRASEV